MATYSRLNARVGNIVNLNMDIYKNGVLSTPYYLDNISIYKGSIRSGNLIDTIVFPPRDDPSYPLPANEIDVGRFVVPYNIPSDYSPCDVYYDVWSFLGDDPGTNITSATTISQVGMFLVYDDTWIMDDYLQSIRFGFEPLDKRIKRGEIRTIEISIYPIPLYDYEHNIVFPIISQLNPKITIGTMNCEIIVDNDPCTIGIKQGSYKNSPYVIKYLIDGNKYPKGAYKYTVRVDIEDKTIISPEFYFTVQ